VLQAARLPPQRRCKGKSDRVSGGTAAETGAREHPTHPHNRRHSGAATSLERGAETRKQEEHTRHQPPPGPPRRHIALYSAVPTSTATSAQNVIAFRLPLAP